MTSLNKTLDHVQPYVLGLFRAVIGLLFASHGAASLEPSARTVAPSPPGSGPTGTRP